MTHIGRDGCSVTPAAVLGMAVLVLDTPNVVASLALCFKKAWPLSMPIMSHSTGRSRRIKSPDAVILRLPQSEHHALADPAPLLYLRSQGRVAVYPKKYVNMTCRQKL